MYILRSLLYAILYCLRPIHNNIPSHNRWHISSLCSSFRVFRSRPSNVRTAMSRTGCALCVILEERSDRHRWNRHPVQHEIFAAVKLCSFSLLNFLQKRHFLHFFVKTCENFFHAKMSYFTVLNDYRVTSLFLLHCTYLIHRSWRFFESSSLT